MRLGSQDAYFQDVDLQNVYLEVFLLFVAFFGHDSGNRDNTLQIDDFLGNDMDEQIRQATRQWTTVQPVISAFLTTVVRDFRDRDDLLQEIAIAVLESYANYDPQRPFVAWALGVARNQVGTYLRKHRRNRVVLDAVAVENVAAAFERIPSVQIQQLDHLRECLQNLDGRAKQICILRYEDDLKPAAIANLIDMSSNAVSKMLQRIREQLRECMERKSATESTPS